MKIPAWFKLAWWLALTLLVSAVFAAYSLPYVLANDLGALDYITLGLLVLLLFMPLVSEFNIFGVSFKRELDEFKSDVKSQLLSLRADVQNSASFTTQINPHLYFGALPTDRQLAEKERQAKPLVREELKGRGVKRAPARLEEQVAVPEANRLLFSVRFEIEKQLKRIAVERELASPRGLRLVPALRIAQWMLEEGMIDAKFHDLLRDVYGICSAAVHAGPLSDKQIAFVRNLAPGVITALKAM